MLDIPSSRVYISRDVIFDEEVFPFSTLHYNAGALLRAEIAQFPPGLVPSLGTEKLVDQVLDSINSATDGARTACDNKGSPLAPSTEPDADPVSNPTESAPGLMPNGVAGGNAEFAAPADPTESSPMMDATLPAVSLSPGAFPSGRAVCPASDAVNPAASTMTVPASHPIAGTGGSGARAVSTAVDGAGAYMVAPTPPRTRLRDGICKPKVYTDGMVRYGCFTASSEHTVS
jgi:hypothetical protein